MMKTLQRLGKSLMLPVACLPAAGILMGIGYWIDQNVMSGLGDPNVVAFFLVKAGGAIIDNMAILFAIGVAVGMSKDQDGTSALAGLVSWLMTQQILSPAVVGVLTGAEANAAFGKINNQFIGIVSGLIGAFCYNKFKDTKLPDALAFFSGKRCVAIMAALMTLIVDLILFFVWPFIYGALISLGEAIMSLGAVGVGIYTFLNRLLIPVGLHHALNSVFWFDVAGINDIARFWGTASVEGLQPGEAGMYMSGFFPVMMFGLPAAALAMYHTAKSNKKKVAAGLLFSGALCAFFTGVTEPLEFSFMFLAPVLYVIYALMCGIVAGITVLFPFRAGFWFSAGFVDWFFSFKAPNAQGGLLLIPIGLVTAVIFYFVFRIAITALDLKTPGREDDDDKEEDMKATLSNDNYTEIARIVLEGLGGKDNIASADNYITRLRMEVKDRLLVDEKKIKSAGVAGVIRPGKNSVQIIIGPKVQFVADELKKML